MAEPLTFTITHLELVNFHAGMADVSTLLAQHDLATERTRGRPDRALEVFKRSAVILSVTAWETYIEDTITQMARERIIAAQHPAEVQRTFNSTADAWLADNPKMNPTKLEAWTGDRWKKLLLENLERSLDQLNTPNSTNIAALSKRFIHLDLTTLWRWQRTSPQQAADRLDELIKLRGALVHRSADVLKPAAVRREDVVDAMNLLNKLVEVTSVGVGRAAAPMPMPAAAPAKAAEPAGPVVAMGMVAAAAEAATKR